MRAFLCTITELYSLPISSRYNGYLVDLVALLTKKSNNGVFIEIQH